MLSHEMGIKEILENPKSIFSLLTPEEKEELQSNISLTNYKKKTNLFLKRRR